MSKFWAEAMDMQAIHSTFATPKHKSMGTKWVFERKGGEGNVFERYMLG